jgi:hypothetical protein
MRAAISDRLLSSTSNPRSGLHLLGLSFLLAVLGVVVLAFQKPAFAGADPGISVTIWVDNYPQVSHTILVGAERAAGRVFRMRMPGALLPKAVWAGDPVIIGATQQQERFLTCVAQVSANDLRDTPNSNERLTVVILEHQKFLEMRDAFHAHKTKLAFSSLEARRIYLSSRTLVDFETLLRCITHELGHFATQSVYEDHAERAADRIRQKARQTCGSDGLPKIAFACVAPST